MLRFLALSLTMICLLCAPQPGRAENAFVQRKVVALYDSSYFDNVRHLLVHRLFEMPANWLGLDVRYHDVQTGFPELGDETLGVIIAFESEPKIDIPSYINWLHHWVVKKGKRLVLAESIGIENTNTLEDASLQKLKEVYARIGMRDMQVWHPLTHKSIILYKDPQMVDFERTLSPPLSTFQEMRITLEGTSHLKVAVSPEHPEQYADLVITGPQGGYVAYGYAYHEQDLQDHYVTAWYLNPFAFLRKSLIGNQHFPIPDVTTRNGRRIFYSHIDGDGWNNLSLIEHYHDTLASSADVIENEILRAYPDFGFSVGLVAGDVVNSCFGSDKSRETARRIYALPNVEPTSHTYTHPLYWEFFEHYTEEKEKPYIRAFPQRAGMFSQDFSSLLTRETKEENFNMDGGHTHNSLRRQEKPRHEMTEKEKLKELYDVPRSYNCVPFDEEKEINEAKAIIEALTPEGKKVELLQWSGNTSPYEGFIRKVREAGMLNINGGESRFDNEYPSYSSLYPIGIRVGKELQIYSTASNENTYTNLWSERFFGYRYLIETVRHTEDPIRVNPFNVYFHSYSGERPASLTALKEIMDYARQRELIPITTSEFARIANGFFSTRIETLGPMHWRIHDREHLQTLRYDNAKTLTVDYAHSKGVLGHRLHQNNLYLFLNPLIDKPEISLINKATKKSRDGFALVSSRWDIVEATREPENTIRLKAKGFGKGEMVWKVPQKGHYEIRVQRASDSLLTRQVASKDGEITFELDVDAVTPVEIVIRQVEVAS